MIDFLRRVWGDATGYVHLPVKEVMGQWREHSFAWPHDNENRTKSFLATKPWESGDVYFAPQIFTGTARINAGVTESRVLYADLDSVDPRVLAPRPTLAWQSSKDRYQAIWLLDRFIPIKQQQEINKALSYAIGADKSGWDITQVLRIPGTLNHKREVPEPVELLWDDGPIHKVSAFDRFLEKARVTAPAKSLPELLAKHKLPEKTSRLLTYPTPEEGRRSEALYRLSAELVEAKVPIEAAYEMLRASAWNKFAGRSDEETRLREGLNRAYASKLPTAEKVREARAQFEPTPFDELMAGAEIGPRWLVEDLWTLGGHGIVAGEPKTFKSTIALDLCISVASGRPLWDQFAVLNQGPVLVIQNENADWIQRERLAKIVGSKKGLLGKASVKGRHLEARWGRSLDFASIDCSGFNLDIEEHRDAMWATIEKFKPALTVFDPLYQMTGADINSAKDLGPALRWLMAVRAQLKTGVMLIHHFNKNGLAARGGQRMLGSTTLHGWTESALYTSGLESIGDGAARITVEREFRAAGAMDRLVLSISQADDDYRVEVGEASDVDRAMVRKALDGSGGKLSLPAIEKATGWSRKKALAAAAGDEALEVVTEGRTRVVRKRVQP